MDGQVERTIQSVEDILRYYVIEFKGKRDDNLSFMEFLYNNRYHSSISFAPSETLYGRNIGIRSGGLR